MPQNDEQNEQPENNGPRRAPNPNRSQRRVLQELSAARLLDTPSLHELVQTEFPKLHTLQVCLGTLMQRRYIEKITVKTQPLLNRGRPPAVWALARKGAVYLGESPKKNGQLSESFKSHELLGSLTYSVQKKACRLLDGFSMQRWERQALLPALKPKLPEYKQESRYETDAQALIMCGDVPMNAFYEIDRKTEPAQRTHDPKNLKSWENQSDFRRKIDFYQELRRRLNHDKKADADPKMRRDAVALRTSLVGHAFVVLTLVPTPGRLKLLRQLCRRVDPLRGDQEEGTGRDYFLFALHEDIDINNPLKFFFDPIWYRPSDITPRSLFSPDPRTVREEPAATSVLAAPSAVDLEMPDVNMLGEQATG